MMVYVFSNFSSLWVFLGGDGVRAEGENLSITYARKSSLLNCTPRPS